MRAIAVVPGTRRIELRDVESPRIASPTDVKLRVLDVGICGTDREISAFQYGTPPPGSEYLVIFGTVNASAEAFEAAIRDLAVFKELWPGALDALITGRFPLDAHRDLLLGPARGIKNVLRVADAAS